MARIAAPKMLKPRTPVAISTGGDRKLGALAKGACKGM